MLKSKWSCVGDCVEQLTTTLLGPIVEEARVRLPSWRAEKEQENEYFSFKSSWKQEFDCPAGERKWGMRTLIMP